MLTCLLCCPPVAKRTSVFDDPTFEIQELTAVIKQDITALNSAVVDLQLLCNSQNESGNISSDTTSHSTTVVDNLKNRLMGTTKEFKEVLTMRTEVFDCCYSLLAWQGHLAFFICHGYVCRILTFFFFCGCLHRTWRFMRIEGSCFLQMPQKSRQILLSANVLWLPD